MVMKIYDYTNYGNCFLGPSIDNRIDNIINIINNGLPSPMVKAVHPKEIERQERLRKREIEEVSDRLVAHLGDIPRPGNLGTYGSDFKKKKDSQMPFEYKDGVMIISGSCGFGTKDFEYFDKKFKELNDALEKSNFHILFVRGNNDDPSYFDEEKINYSNIKSLVSNCIVKFSDFSCLCVGGGISVDREWKKAKSKEYGTTMYWEGEKVDFDLEDIRNAVRDNNIACVVSHEVPTFIGPGTGAYKNNRWFKNDSELLADTIKCRMKMDTLYNEFVKAGKKPYIWWYSRDDNGNHNTTVNDIFFRCAGCIDSLNSIVQQQFGVYLTEKERKANEDFMARMKKAKLSSWTTTTTASAWDFMFDEPNDPIPVNQHVEQAVNNVAANYGVVNGVINEIEPARVQLRAEDMRPVYGGLYEQDMVAGVDMAVGEARG